MQAENEKAMVTLAVPSLNQGRFLDDALSSIFNQDVPVEVMLADGGSTDETQTVIDAWQGRLTWWRSSPDTGQSAAINEAMALGRAPYVAWLNSDDMLLPGSLKRMVNALQDAPSAPAVYGRSRIIDEYGERLGEYRTLPFSESKLAVRCFISQPATLIRREIWDVVGGLNPDYSMALDYDLWWRIYRQAGPLHYVPLLVACSRTHDATKTMRFRSLHYREAMQVLSRHYGKIPLKWYLAWPYAVWCRAMARKIRAFWKHYV